MEKHLPHVTLGKPVGGLLGNQPTFDRALLHALVIYSTPVIFDFDVNVVAAVIGAQHDIPRGRFARSGAVSALFDAVRHRVADQVNERIGNLLNNIVVELGFTPGKVQLDVLASRG